MVPFLLDRGHVRASALGKFQAEVGHAEVNLGLDVDCWQPAILGQMKRRESGVVWACGELCEGPVQLMGSTSV